ncbi:MAG TPA: MAPEG family protein [Caulobacteraceae bacterium]
MIRAFSSCGTTTLGASSTRASPRSRNASPSALYFSDVAAAALGLLWVVGRLVYFLGYRKAVEGRLPGFFIQSSACMLLFLGAGYGVVRHALGG